MRAADSADGLKVAAIAGSYVTLLGMDMARQDCEGLLGFAVHRTDHTTGANGYMRQFKAFRNALNGAARPYSTRQHPIQSFWWEDYTAQPGHEYTYKVSALTGSVSAPDFGAQVSVSLHTERPSEGVHDIYFNRGVSASQRYAVKFDNKSPVEVGQEAWTWLSRGLYEALCDYVRASDANTALRIAAYELNYAPFLDKSPRRGPRAPTSISSTNDIIPKSMRSPNRPCGQRVSRTSPHRAPETRTSRTTSSL